MIKKTVIISCAGTGSRLGKQLPKCLVEINDKSILEIQLEQLKDVEDIRIVVGYKKELIIDKLKDLNIKVKVFENKEYQTTGTAASFCTAIDETVNDFVIALDGDLIVNPIDMEKILNSKEELICGEEKNTENPVMITLNEKGEVTEFSREHGVYEWAGLAQIKKEKIVKGTNHVYQLLEPILPIKFQLIRAKEIDTLSDLEQAKQWIKENLIEKEKNIIDQWFKSRFSIEDNYEVSRYSKNNRIDYDINLISKYINENSNVLDLGCGTGIIESRLEPLVQSIKAIDKYQEFLERAQKSSKIDYLKHDIVTYRDECIYNLILMFGVSMYITDEELEKILYNCRKMMDNESTFILKNQWSISGVDFIVNKQYSEKNPNQYYGIYRSIDKMEQILKDIYFSSEIIDIYPPSMNPYTNTHELAFICKKLKKTY